MIDLERVEKTLNEKRATYAHVNRDHIKTVMKEEFADQLLLKLDTDMAVLNSDMSMATNFMGGCSSYGQNAFKKNVDESFEFLSIISDGLPEDLQFVTLDDALNASMYDKLDVLISVYNTAKKLEEE